MEAKIVDLITKHFKPESIFIYGSRARTDFLDESDYEIGVLFSDVNYVGRRELKKVVITEGVNVYPFMLNDFKKGILDTPFQKNIYLRELVASGHTIFGEKVVESMELPKIQLIDVIQDLRFNLGYALSAVITARNGDAVTSSTLFYKSCLFATRSLVILKNQEFPATYDEIVKESAKLELNEYAEIVSNAFKVRLGKTKVQESDLYKNISYLNKFIEPKLMESYQSEGNITLLQKILPFQ